MQDRLNILIPFSSDGPQSSPTVPLKSLTSNPAATHYPQLLWMTGKHLCWAYFCQAHTHFFHSTLTTASQCYLIPFYRWGTEAPHLTARKTLEVGGMFLLQDSLGSYWRPEGPCVWWRHGPEVRRATLAQPLTSVPSAIIPLGHVGILASTLHPGHKTWLWCSYREVSTVPNS